MVKRIVVGLMALLCVALLVGAVGCGSTSSKGDPEKTVNDFWSAMQKGDFAKAKTYLANSIADTALEDFTGQSDPMTAMMIEAIMGSFVLKTTGSSVNGDSATVNVELTMPDMDLVGEEIATALFANMGEDLSQLNEEQILEQLAKKLPEIIKDAPTTTESDEINLVWEDGAWKINANPFENLGGQF